jgi:hypothetical protein
MGCVPHPFFLKNEERKPMQFLEKKEYAQKKEELLSKLIETNASTPMIQIMIQLFQANYQLKGGWNRIKWLWNQIKGYWDIVWICVFIWFIYELTIVLIGK